MGKINIILEQRRIQNLGKKKKECYLFPYKLSKIELFFLVAKEVNTKAGEMT